MEEMHLHNICWWDLLQAFQQLWHWPYCSTSFGKGSFHFLSNLRLWKVSKSVVMLVFRDRSLNLKLISLHVSLSSPTELPTLDDGFVQFNLLFHLPNLLRLWIFFLLMQERSIKARNTTKYL